MAGAAVIPQLSVGHQLLTALLNIHIDTGKIINTMLMLKK